MTFSTRLSNACLLGIVLFINGFINGSILSFLQYIEGSIIRRVELRGSECSCEIPVALLFVPHAHGHFSRSHCNLGHLYIFRLRSHCGSRVLDFRYSPLTRLQAQRRVFLGRSFGCVGSGHVLRDSSVGRIHLGSPDLGKQRASPGLLHLRVLPSDLTRRSQGKGTGCGAQHFDRSEQTEGRLR